jgi:hypothetical protein
MTATAPQPTHQPTATDGTSHVWWWVIGAVLVVLCVIGLITYGSNQRTAEAQAKAAQLIAAYEQAGLPVPSDQATVERTFGTDGGNVCANPANALGRATLFDSMTNGGSFVGRRAVLIDRTVLKGQALIMQTYCPDKLQEFQEKTQDLKTDDTISYD